MTDYSSFAIGISLIPNNWGYLKETLCIEKLLVSNLVLRLVVLNFIKDYSFNRIKLKF